MFKEPRGICPEVLFFAPWVHEPSGNIRPMLLALPLALLLSAPAEPAPITANYLRAHVKFLASDNLGGRNTPSLGLDIAADYIASHFEQIGLEAPIKGGYFQETTYGRGEVKVPVRNVIGVIRGSDPVLKDTYMFVTAHYDHLATREGEGDQIYNGANDDASGVAGMIEVARSLVAAKPKRSIIFMAFYGEEKGMVGSTYYGQNPIFPLKASIAQINLEQIGRTDDDEGARVGAFNLTGFDYTNLSTFLGPAAKKAGIKLEKHEKNNEPYFMRSDNAALARVGVPSTTISTAYSYPDYHGAGDHWDKLDYTNFAKVANAISGGVLAIANSSKPVEWTASNPKVARYIEAQKKQAGGR